MKRIVAEITVVVDTIGTEQTFYFASSGFTTRPTDTPANVYMAGRLKDAGSYRRELFSGTRVTGAVRSSFGNLILRNEDGGLDSWLGYGVSMGKVVLRLGEEDAAYPTAYTHIVTCYAQYIRADFRQVEIVLRDRLHLLDKPMVTASFEGSGGLEGASNMAGTLKQWVSQDPGYFPPILIDPGKQIYFVQSVGTGGLSSLFAAYEGGIQITRGANYPDSATLLSTSPSPGQVRFWFGESNIGPVYFRLGSVPVFNVRVYGHGYNQSGSTWTFANLAALAGINDVSSSSLNVGAVLVDDSRTYLDVMEDSAKQRNIGWFGLTKDDRFVSKALSAPSLTALHTFTHRNARDWTRQPVQDMDAPVYSLTVNTGKTWPSNLANGVSAELQDRLTRSPWRATTSRDVQAIKNANPGAVADVVEIQCAAFVNNLGATLYLDAYFALFGVARDCYTCTAPMTSETLSLDLHDTVAIKMPRFGLDNGKNFRIITMEYDLRARQITFAMWG